MEEKTYKDMGGSGALGMTLGILSIVFGIVSGILLIVNAGKLFSHRSKMMI